MASNKGRVYFSLAGYRFNPDDVTRHLDIEPTSVNREGASSDAGKPAISSWELSTETSVDDVDVYSMTRDLLKKIEQKKEAILEVIERYNLSPRVGVVLVLSVDKGESAPDVGLGSRAIRFLADIGAFIDIDYQLSNRI